MNLQWLYYFNTIAELEHYTRAAEKLHVSQSNLSHAIKELENELGVQLFERQGRNIKLTKYGEIFQPYVIRTINSLEDGITTLKGYIDPNEGIISLAGFPSMAQFAPDLMVRYQSETNRLGVQFQYSQEGWKAIYNMLLDGAVDLILSTKLEHPQIEAAYIGTHRLVLLVPEGHRLAGKGCVDLKELDGENYIAFDPSGQLRSQLDELFKELGVRPNMVMDGGWLLYHIHFPGRHIIRRFSLLPTIFPSVSCICSGIRSGISLRQQSISVITSSAAERCSTNIWNTMA